MTQLLLLALHSWTGTESMTSAKEEVAFLTSALHQPIGLAPNLAKEVIYLRTNGAEPAVVLHALATALHASVIHVKSGLAIKRTAHDIAEILQTQTKDRADWITATKKRQAEFRKLQFPEGLVPAKVEAELDRELHHFEDITQGKSHKLPEEFVFASFSPSSELLFALIERLGEQVIGQLPSDRICTFESPAGPGTRRLPDCSDLLENYSSSVQSLSAITLSQYAQSQLKGTSLLRVITAAQSGTSVQPAVIRLSVMPSQGSIGFWLELYDQAGALLDEGFLGASQQRPFLSTIEADRVATKGTLDKWVSLSADARAAATIASYQRLQSPPECLIAPNSIEPLTLLVKEAMATLTGDATKKCVVADVPDEFLQLAGQSVVKERLDTTGFRKLVENSNALALIDTRTAMIWRPTDPEYVEAVRANRNSLGRYAKGILAKTSSRLRLESRLYYEAFPARWSWISPWSEAAINLLGRKTFDVFISPSLYPIIGAISDGDWEQLESGSVMTAGKLGVVSELLNWYQSDRPEPKRETGPVVDLYRHPEELYTNVSLESTPISVRTTKTPVVTVWGPNDKESGFWMPQDQLYSRFIPFQYEDPYTGNFVTTRKEFDEKCIATASFRKATQTDESIRVGLPGGYSIEAKLSADVSDPGAILTFADLPQEYKDNVWKVACDIAHEDAEVVRKHMSNPPAKTQPPAQNRVPPP